MRGERYYRARAAIDAPPARAIGLQRLDVLRRIQNAGEVAHLVLTFGPHAGEPLGKIAQTDPDQVRRLATTVQRPDLRAAATRLMMALRDSPATNSRQTSSRARRGTWRRAS